MEKKIWSLIYSLMIYDFFHLCVLLGCLLRSTRQLMEYRPREDAREAMRFRSVLILQLPQLGLLWAFPPAQSHLSAPIFLLRRLRASMEFQCLPCPWRPPIQIPLARFYPLVFLTMIK